MAFRFLFRTERTFWFKNVIEKCIVITLIFSVSEGNSNEKIHTITIDSNETNEKIACTLSPIQSIHMPHVSIHGNIQTIVMDSKLSNSEVFKCFFAHNKNVSIKMDFLLAVSVVPTILSENDAQLISVKSNKLPTLKCAKNELIQTKFIEQPYVCDSFNNVSTSSDSFHILIQGKICARIQINYVYKMNEFSNIFR